VCAQRGPRTLARSYSEHSCSLYEHHSQRYSRARPARPRARAQQLIRERERAKGSPSLSLSLSLVATLRLPLEARDSVCASAPPFGPRPAQERPPLHQPKSPRPADSSSWRRPSRPLTLHPDASSNVSRPARLESQTPRAARESLVSEQVRSPASSSQRAPSVPCQKASQLDQDESQKSSSR